MCRSQVIQSSLASEISGSVLIFQEVEKLKLSFLFFFQGQLPLLNTKALIFPTTIDDKKEFS